MGKCKKDLTPLLMYQSYVFLAQTHRCDHGYYTFSDQFNGDID